MKENRFFRHCKASDISIKMSRIFSDNLMQLLQLVPSELKETLSWNQHPNNSSFRYNWFRSSIAEGKRNGNLTLFLWQRSSVPFQSDAVRQNDRAALMDSITAKNDIFLLTHPWWRTDPVTDVEVSKIFFSKHSFAFVSKDFIKHESKWIWW